MRKLNITSTLTDSYYEREREREARFLRQSQTKEEQSAAESDDTGQHISIEIRKDEIAQTEEDNVRQQTPQVCGSKSTQIAENGKAKADNVHQQPPQLCGSEITQIAENDKAKANNDETKAKGDETRAENDKHEAEKGHPNDNVKEHTENEATKRKVDDARDVAVEPIQVSAEKIAKPSITEEKTEDDAKERQATTTTNVADSPDANDMQKTIDFVASSGIIYQKAPDVNKKRELLLNEPNSVGTCGTHKNCMALDIRAKFCQKVPRPKLSCPKV